MEPQREATVFIDVSERGDGEKEKRKSLFFFTASILLTADAERNEKRINNN